MKFREFTGKDSELVGKGRAELPETIMIRDAMEASATQNGKKIEFVDLKPTEITKTKNRIPNIAARFGYSYRMWESENGVVLSATFKEAKPEKDHKEEAKAEPAPAPKKTTTPRRRATKRTAATSA